MRVYLAGMYNGASPLSAAAVAAYPHSLESFHYLKNQRVIDRIRAEKRQVFLDSGAFSAFTQKLTIKIESYAAFINKNRDIVEFAADLDDLSSTDPDVGAEGTWRNQKALEALVPKGLYVVPVYHVREHPRFLKRIVDNYEFMAIGGMVPESVTDLRLLLDEIWSRYLTDAKGRPRLRVHGFGLTTIDLMTRYPWWSVDSTTWLMNGRMGSVSMLTDDRRIVKAAISEKSPTRRDLGRHFDTLSPIEQETFRKMAAAKGFKVEELRTMYWKRDEMNMRFYGDMASMGVTTFKRDTGDLFA